MFHNLQSAYRVNFNYISKCKMLLKNNSKTVVKTCENDFNNTILVAKVKVDFILMVEKSYNKTVIDFNFGRHKDYLPSKVIFTSALRPR